MEDENHPTGFVGWESHVDLIPNEAWRDGVSPEVVLTINEELDTVIGATPIGITCKFLSDVLEAEIEAMDYILVEYLRLWNQCRTTMDWLLNTHSSMFALRSTTNLSMTPQSWWLKTYRIRDRVYLEAQT
jgi:hypothetical protein